MITRKPAAAVALTIGALLALCAAQPADAQQRKSLRWTTSQVGTYGYAVAASMAKIAEQALGGEYTVTVQPYANPTVAMKAVMNGEGEIAYTADVGTTQFSERDRQHKGDQLLPTTATSVEKPDEPDDLDQSEGKRQVLERGKFLERFAHRTRSLRAASDS